MPMSAEQAVADAFRDEWGRIVATLIRRTGSWDLAEECAQEAFTQALVRWPAAGVPENPGAWLTTVAGNRAIDRLRRAKRGSELIERVAREDLVHATVEEAPEEGEAHVIEDDRLRLMFTCCHPALALEARVALTLRTLAGLTTAEIARAFLVAEPTMAKRLVRAKAKIAGAGIPYRVPPPELLSERLSGVLAVLYLLFNEGYSASSGDDLIRAGLCVEAIRLARLLQRLMPAEPEVNGLLVLMLLQHSRRDARIDTHGDLVTLEHQNRAAWHHDEISEAQELMIGGPPGPYLLQAEIAACHALAPDAESTDWQRIAALYDLLAEVLPSPVVQLNRAVAVAMAGDIDSGLAIVARLADDRALAGYHLLPATRADLLRRCGAGQEALEQYREALALAPSGPERRYLSRRIAELTR